MSNKVRAGGAESTSVPLPLLRLAALAIVLAADLPAFGAGRVQTVRIGVPAKETAGALLNARSDSPAAGTARCAGWTVSLNYQPVHECFKELRIGPYWDFGKVTLGDFFKKYWYWPVIAAAAVVLMAATTVFVLGLNRRLHHAESELRNELAKRKRAEEELRQAKETAEKAITDLAETNRQLEAAIERANRMAEAAEVATLAKSEFLANMSHEIRTPLTAILGYADLMMDPRQDSSERLNCLSIVYRNSKHLLDLINDILDISRIEAGKFTIDTRPCSVPAVVAEVVSMMRVRAEEGGISLKVEYTGELPETILTDPARFRQALINLVGNAVKFTETGVVRLVVSFLPDWRGVQPAVEIKVVDTGIGIAPEKLVNLFQPFVQADASTSRKYGGSGLGLAITRHVLEMMEGELTVESTLGAGSVFAMTVPTGNLEGVRMLARPAEAAVQQPAEVQPYSSNLLAGRRILLAEDGEDNMRLIRTILRKAGADVVAVENGRIAVEKAMAPDSPGFGVILMDMQMPEMDGYQATKHLRSEGYNGPVIALTAHTTARDRDRCISAGCDDYISKPIDRALLIVTIAKHLGIAADGAAEPPKPTRAEDDENEVIRSRFADEADLAGIIDEFIAGLPARLEEMRRAAAHSDHERLRRLAHQLKGAGGGYGYPALTTAARALEDAAKAGDIEAAGLTLKKLAVLHEAVARGRSGVARASRP